MTPAQAKAMYRRQMAIAGETILLRRKGRADVAVRARSMGLNVSDVAGVVQQGARVLIVLAEDVAKVGFPIPFQANVDRVVWNGRTLAITYADDARRRIAGEVIAYELHVSGQ